MQIVTSSVLHGRINNFKVVMKPSVLMSFLDGLGDVMLAIHNHMATD